MSDKPSLANGASLTSESWTDFVARLHHDCVGEGVRDHCTADAVFLVQQAVEQLVPEGYGGDPVIFDGCEHSEPVPDFYANCCDETKAKLDKACDGSFIDSDEYDQEQALKECLPDYSLLYVTTRWETLNQHFTKAAAEAFIKRKKHDYRKVTEHANASNQRTMAANEPLRTICAQVKGGHFSVVAPTMIPLRGTSESHLNGKAVNSPLGTVTACGQHQAMAMAHITKFNTGSVGSALDEPLPTVVAGGKPKRPSTGITMGMIAAHLVDMGHGEGPNGGKRWSHGARSIELPLNTVTASGATSAVATAQLEQLSAACMEQAYGGFYDGDGRAASEPMATVTASGSQQRLITACLVKYYSEGGQDSACTEPMHTVPTKDRMALVQTAKVPAANLDPAHEERARKCAALLQEHLPEQFSEPSEMVLMWHGSQWWVLVDITLRMLKPRELSRAQGFPESYHIDQIPDPAILFKDGQQAVGNPLSIPLIKLSTTAQVRMIGNSVSPPMAHALVMANFKHEVRMYA